MKKFQRLATYLICFVLARGMLFASPILLANLLSNYSYGVVEWAHAAATFISTIVALGTSAVIPLIVLKNVQKCTVAGVLIHHILLVLVCFTLVCISLYFDGGDAIIFGALLTAALALQVFWSNYLKTHGRGEASMLLDASLFALMALITAIANYFHVSNPFLWVMWAVSIYTFCLLCISVVKFFSLLHYSKTIAYRAVLILGLPLMMAALVTVAVTISGRLAIGYLGGPLLTADYAALARVTALPIVAHQIIMVAKFRYFFTLQDKEVEGIMLTMLSCVALLVVGLWVCFPLLGGLFGQAFKKTFMAESLPALWLLAQSILWSAIALHDTINTRHQTINKVLAWSVAYIIISIPLAFLVIQVIGVSLANFVYVHGIFMLLYYITQIISMYRAGIRLIRPWTFSLLAYIGLVGLATVIY